MIGGSTGGWEAFGVQVMYPDAYNGAWALCPDPIDFRSYRSVNIYDEKNAYYYEDNPWQADAETGLPRLPRSSLLDVRGSQPRRARARHARALGRQHDAWASVFGPVGADGYYKPLYDKATGAIDPEVAKYWRDHYDLRYILARDWSTLGPKLRGKIHITSGTMDKRLSEQRRVPDGRIPDARDAVGRGGDHLRRAPRALLHGRHRSAERRRQPHGSPAVHAGHGGVDEADCASGGDVKSWVY
jgi:hypothetical protein